MDESKPNAAAFMASAQTPEAVANQTGSDKAPEGDLTLAGLLRACNTNYDPEGRLVARSEDDYTPENGQE